MRRSGAMSIGSAMGVLRCNLSVTKGKGSGKDQIGEVASIRKGVKTVMLLGQVASKVMR